MKRCECPVPFFYLIHFYFTKSRSSIYSFALDYETFLEEVSSKIKVHPISVYWFLKQGIEKNKWRCPTEEKRFAEDLLTIVVLQLIGHSWPEETGPSYISNNSFESDGIIPKTEFNNESSLFHLVRDRLTVIFPSASVYDLESEFEKLVGLSLESWISTEFFKRHISQYNKRPVAWQIQSKPPITGTLRARSGFAFSCLIASAF